MRRFAGAPARHICSGAPMPSSARPLRSTCAGRDHQREARTLQRLVVDQEALGIIVTVEFAGQILEVERDLVRREVARRRGDLAGKVGEPAQQRLLVRARQRREVGVGERAPAHRRARCPPAAAPTRRARARTARSRPGSPRTASARGRCRTRTRVSALRETRKKRTASRPDLVDQVAHRHVAAGALADLHFLAAAHHRHHLVQHVVGIARRDADAERLQPGAHARDRAVVVGALHVDRPCAKPRSHLVT